MIRINFVIVFCCLLSCGLFQSCTKDRPTYHEENFNAINDAVLSCQALYDVVRIVDQAASNPLDSGSTTDVSFLKDSLNTIMNCHLNFGDVPNSKPDGRMRSGLMEVKFTKPYFQLNSPVEVTFNDYEINGARWNGTLAFTIYDAQLGMKRIKIEFNAIHVKTNTNDYELNSMWFLNCSSVISDAYAHGNINGIGEGNHFSFATRDSIWISHSTHCFEGGKCDLSTGDYNAMINYGDHQLDSLATATSDDFRYILKLKGL